MLVQPRRRPPHRASRSPTMSAPGAKHGVTVDGLHHCAWAGASSAASTSPRPERRNEQYHQGRFRWCVDRADRACDRHQLHRSQRARGDVARGVEGNRRLQGRLCAAGDDLHDLLRLRPVALRAHLRARSAREMGFTISIVVWSLSIAAHALVRSMPCAHLVAARNAGRSARRATGPAPRRPMRYGFRRANARWRRASSTRVRRWAASSRRR